MSQTPQIASTINPTTKRPRIKRGMRSSPLASLLVNEHDLPRRAKQDALRKRQYVIRRTQVFGGIADVIGEGEFTRVWFGKNEKAVSVITMDQEQMRELIRNFNEAISK